VMNAPPYQEVVERAGAFFETETAVYVISGYLADMVLLQALSDNYDLVFVDERSHYSVFDGLHATGKRLVPFRHLDANDLAHKLRGEVKPGQTPLVMSDGIFPSTGTIAPLKDYVEVLAAYNDALTCIDDSHAVGVIGEKGQGTYEYLDLQGSNRYLAGTLAKAFGGVGGIVPGSHELKEKIKQHSRVPIGASPASVAAAAAAAMGLRILSEHPEMRKQLWCNVARVRGGLRKLGLNVGTSPVPIVSLQSTSGLDVKRLLQELDKRGIVVAHVAARGYSDALEVESLRIAVFSTHTKAQIDRLLEAIGKLL